MPTYKIRNIKKGRTTHYCSGCNSEIRCGEPKTEIFGCAFQGDKPYTVYFHPNCYDKSGYTLRRRGGQDIAVRRVYT